MKQTNETDNQDLKVLEGKTIKLIEYPQDIKFGGRSYDTSDDNIQITFTDGTVLKMGSWDYEGYSSGIYKEILTPLSEVEGDMKMD